MLKTTPRGTGSSAARRARAQAERDSAEAELRSLAAQEAARVAEAEAEGARREAEQRRARLARDEVVARFDAVYADAPTGEPKPHVPTWEESCRRYERRQEIDRRLTALEAWKPPERRWTAEEIEATRTFLDAALAASEHDDERRPRTRLTLWPAR